MDPIVLTTQEHLELLMMKAVEAALQRVVPGLLQRAALKPYLTKEELMKLTGWSARQIEYRKQERRIPFIQHGRKILFPSQEVVAFLEQGRVPVKGQSSSVEPAGPNANRREPFATYVPRPRKRRSGSGGK